MTWVKWNVISVHLETGLVSMQHSCIVCAKCIIGSKSFWTHPMVLRGYEAQVKARFSPFGDSANLDVDRCTVCAEHTIGSEIVLDALDGTPR